MNTENTLSQAVKCSGKTAGESFADNESEMRNCYRVWIQSDDSQFVKLIPALDSKRSAIRKSRLPQILHVSSQADADLQLVDCRASKHSSYQITSRLPALLVINKDTNFDALEESDSGVELLLDFISEAELSSRILELRIAKLLKRCKKHIQSEQTEIILNAAMKYSNEWMTVKDLNHRFLNVTGKFSRTHGKSIDEVVGDR